MLTAPPTTTDATDVGVGLRKVPSIEALISEMPGKEMRRDRGRRMFKIILNRLRLRRYASATISKPDPTYRVAYLGNVVTGWAKGDGCVEKPLATLWKNYTHSSRPDVRMQLTVSGGGLRATTKDHGLTEYWAHRLTTCAAPPQFPRLFCWVYRHEGRRLRHELRCHAVLCSTSAVAKQIEEELKQSLALALLEFKRDKISRQNARLSLVNSVYENPTIPRRKILLSTGSHNYKPPLERSKSAPKLTSIEEIVDEEVEDDVFHTSQRIYKEILKQCDHRRKTALLDQRTDTILEELGQGGLTNDLVESCELAWLSALHQKKPDLIPSDGDEGSLSSSSGCESLGGLSPPAGGAFKVGGAVLGRARSFERVANPDLLRCCGVQGVVVTEQDEVSLVPVGESPADFSSLKVFKKRCFSDPCNAVVDNDEVDETDGACSDESGYEEDELASSVANVVLV